MLWKPPWHSRQVRVLVEVEQRMQREKQHQEKVEEEADWLVPRSMDERRE